MYLMFEDVNDAFGQIILAIETGDCPTIKTDSRNGPVMQIPEPVLIRYERPLNRVLLYPNRDANPFFHLYEALWMLSGRNDVSALKFYASKISDYSDDGTTFNGAYGYRWRHAKDPKCFVLSSNYPNSLPIPASLDQLEVIADHLKRKPESRRVVLQMWNVEDDLTKIDSSKDVCCNLSVMFSLREVENPRGEFGDYRVGDQIVPSPRVLDMTVTNRSNDLIWGCLGANYVHFTFLQEYLAAKIGVKVGYYYHFTNNLHVYTETNSGWKPDEWLSSRTWLIHNEMTPLVEDPKQFDHELQKIVELYSKPITDPQIFDNESEFFEPFFSDVAEPMFLAYQCYKTKEWSKAYELIELVLQADWRHMGAEWIRRRHENSKKGVEQ